MTTPTPSNHDPQIVAALKKIIARHATDFRLPLAICLLGTLGIGGPLCSYLGLFDGYTGTSFRRMPLGVALLGPAVMIGVLVIMLLVAVSWDSRRGEASKRAILAEIAAAFPDPARYALAMAALRDLPGEHGVSDVLGSLQNDLRQAQAPAGSAASELAEDACLDLLSVPANQDVARFCAQCGKPAAEGTSFCAFCGAPH